MKKINYLLILTTVWGAIYLSSCNNSGGFQKTASGIEYKFLKQNKDKNAKKVKPGTFIDFHMVIKNAKDSVVENTYKASPYKGQQFPEAKTKGDMLEGFMLMAEGDSAIFKISTDSLLAQNKRRMQEQVKQLKEQLKMQSAQTQDAAVKKQIEGSINNQIKSIEEQMNKPIPELPKGKYFSYTVKVLAVRTQEEMQKEQQEGMKKQQQEAENQKKKDDKIIKDYLAKNKLEAKSTASGLHYIITQEGSGDSPKLNDSVKVNYTGMLLDGIVFDTSIKEVAEKNKIANPQRQYAPFEFMIGRRMVIAGWDEGIALLKKGTKAKLLIPSGLGYGPMGAGKDIPPHAVLIFEVELLDFKASKLPEDKPIK